MEISFDVNILYLAISIVLIIAGLIIAIINVFSKDIEYSKNYLKSRFYKFLPYCLFVIAAILVYLSAGNSVLSSVFNGIGCFLHVNTNYISNNYVSLVNTFATIVTISALVSSLREFIKLFIYFIAEKVFCKDIYVIHGNSDTVKLIRHNFEIKNHIVIEVDNKNEKFYHNFNKHILAYDSEDRNMKIAVLINEVNSNATLYVLSSSCDSTLFMRNSINIIDKNELAIKEFWKSYGQEIYEKLKEKDFKNCRISIVGANEIAYYMYLHVLKNCVYRLYQSININVLTTFFDKNYYELANESIVDKMTYDTVTINSINFSNVYDMQESDVVIVTDKSILSKIAIKYRYGQLVYLYDSNFNRDDYTRSSNSKEKENNIRPFGADISILTADNILNNDDVWFAKKVYFGYEKNNVENEIVKNRDKYINEEEFVNALWDDIKTNVIYNMNSNYCAADYRFFKKFIDKEEGYENGSDNLKQLVHINWSRVMYLEGFRYYKEYKLNDKLVSDIEKCVIKGEGSETEIKEVKVNMINHKIHNTLKRLDTVKDADELIKDSNIYSETNN